MESIPKKTLIVGGGYIATELCQILTIFGSETTILVRFGMLTTFDQEMATYQMTNFEDLGIAIQVGQVEKIEKLPDGKLKVTKQDGHFETFDCVLMAVGRTANVESLDLKNTDVQFTKTGHIQVDDFENTTAPGVHAVGDVNGKIALTPVAIRAGRILSERLFNNRPTLKMDYENIPSVIFSHPPIGSVGLSEEKAVMRYGQENVVVYKTQFGNMYDSLVQGDKLKVRTFMKMVCLKKGAEEKVIGFHAIGKGVDEMIQGVAVALKAGGKFHQYFLRRNSSVLLIIYIYQQIVNIVQIIVYSLFTLLQRSNIFMIKFTSSKFAYIYMNLRIKLKMLDF